MSHAQHDTLLQLYATMVASRESDIVEAELVNSGEANFLAAGNGHEGSVILAPHLIAADYLHCHYRDKALMLGRGVTNEMFFLSALCKADSHSAGRQMVSHMSDANVNVMSIVGPVGNNALQAAGVAHVIKGQPDNPIVLCCIGDGTSQQGEVLEAIAESVRDTLPVLFFIHNNELAISTRTKGRTFFSLPDGSNPQSYHSIPITYIDGTDPLKAFDQIGDIVSTMRQDRQPKIVVFNVDRLANHSNADDQKLYRSENEIADSFSKNDPIAKSKAYLLSLGIDEGEITVAAEQAKLQVREAVDKARQAPEPEPCFTASKPLPKHLERSAAENRGHFEDETERLSMIQAMRAVLEQQLKADKNVILFGEDLEDGKGDVFGMTRGLSTAFPGQVRNSPLSESTIVGVSSGMALAKARPVAFLQFADFMPIAYNQLLAEVGSMYWRTNGSWQCPVIVMAACGAYRPGLGPFHSQTNESTVAHIPGVDVFMPSNAADAAGMLNAAFQSGRPSVILYPKKLLNNKGLAATTSPDVDQRLVPIGKARTVSSGQDLTLIGWGNTVALCEEVGQALEVVGVTTEVIDLRTLSPYDLDTIVASAEKTGHVIVSHEDNHTCGLGAEIVAAISEHANRPVKVKRVTRADTFIPCNFPNQLAILPSFESILAGAAELLDLELHWETHEPADASKLDVKVIGASPSDESVIITELHIKVGDHIAPGDKLVDTEASKSAGEILAPCKGEIESIAVTEGESVKVGENLLTLKLDQTISPAQMALHNNRTPVLSRKLEKAGEIPGHATAQHQLHPVGIGIPCFKTGSQKVPNSEILKQFPDLSNEDIIQRTGIENRFWLAEGESPIDLTATAAREVLEKQHLKLNDIHAVICCTDTPYEYTAPSTACLVLNKLYETYGEQVISAYDMNAACSGYIYALQQAKDYLQTRPNERVLLLTCEAVSTRLDKTDFETAFLFADAVTATIVYGASHLKDAKAMLEHTLVFAQGEDGTSLTLPVARSNQHKIHMAGKTIFTQAVKNMATAMMRCCHDQGLDMKDLDLIVPHQANERIAKAIERRLKLTDGTMYSNVSNYGNTSSSTIPIALAETLDKVAKDHYIGLCAFGGGFTFGAAVLKAIK